MHTRSDLQRIQHRSRDTTSSSRLLVSRNDPAVDATGDVAIGIAIPGLIVLCAGATLLYLVIREVRRKNAGEQISSSGFIAWLMRRTRPAGVVSTRSARVADTLVLRQLNTYRFVVAAPRRRITTPLLDVESVNGEQALRPDGQAEQNTTHGGHPAGLSRSLDDPFLDKNIPDSAGISPPPSVILRSRLTLSDTGESLHWDSASSSHRNPFNDPRTSIETASMPGSARASAPSFIGSTTFSGRALALTESTTPTPRSESDDFGYLSDTTISTLPPSYRTNRPNVPLVPHLPLSTQTSTHDTITAPPSAFRTRNRRRSIMHGPRPPSGARQQGAVADQGSAVHEDSNGGHDLSEGGSRRARDGGQYTPRKSVDGGVRLAGGPLEIGGETGAVIDGTEELDPPPAYKGPRRML